MKRQYKYDHLAAIRRNNKKTYHKNKTKVDALKIERGCVDCGFNTHPAALDLHHIGEKSFNISSSGLYRSWANIMAEIDKCVVLCANCHRIRHHA